MRFLAYDGGRCRFEYLGWCVLRGGRDAKLGLLGDLGWLAEEDDGDGEGGITAVIGLRDGQASRAEHLMLVR